jgi:hypothetical protein
VKIRSLARTFVVVAVGATGLSGVPLALGAEGPGEADVILPDCPATALDARALFAALTLELEHDGVRRTHQVASPRSEAEMTIELAFDCHAEAVHVRLRVRDSRQHEAQRTMDVADLPRRLRARAVALAAAELARSTWSGASTLGQVEPTPPDDSGADTRPAAAPSDGSPSAIMPSPPRPSETPNTAKPRHESAAVSPALSPQRRWRGLGLGATTRWFGFAASPSFGGRVAVRLDRLQVGADMLFGYASRFATSPSRALAVGWTSFDALARERGSWRLATGPRLSVGAGWASPAAINQEAPVGGPVSEPASAEIPAAATRGWYCEGALMAELRARTARGWLIALEMAAGLGWGTAPGRDSARPSLRPNLGASLLAGHGF